MSRDEYRAIINRINLIVDKVNSRPRAEVEGIISKKFKIFDIDREEVRLCIECGIQIHRTPTAKYCLECVYQRKKDRSRIKWHESKPERERLKAEKRLKKRSG